MVGAVRPRAVMVTPVGGAWIFERGLPFGNLVNKAAQAESDFIRVVPNNAQDSYLVIAFEDRRRVRGLMLQGGVPLDSIDLANIRNWIEQGALNN